MLTFCRHKTTQCAIPKEQNPRLHCCGNLKICTVTNVFHQMLTLRICWQNNLVNEPLLHTVSCLICKITICVYVCGAVEHPTVHILLQRHSDTMGSYFIWEKYHVSLTAKCGWLTETATIHVT